MISVIITDYNDHEECNATVRSIRETASDGPEVVVLDDGSPSPLRLKDEGSAIVGRVQHRIGVGPSRHYAATVASRDWILLTDSHMRFTPDWYQAACDVIKSGTEKTLWCCQCINLTPQDMDLSKPHGKYYGARLLFTGPDNNNPKLWQVLEGKWISDPGGDGYEIGCIMGASYLMHRDFFFQIGGLRQLKQWGSDEPFLALKVWQSGGECRFAKAVQIGHQFRQVAFHRNDTSSYIYNKALVAMLCLPQAAAEKLIAELPKQYRMPGDVAQAKRWIVNNRPEIECERAYLEAMRTMPFEAYCEKFGVERFWH